MNRNPPFWLTALIILISLPLLLPFLYVVVRAVDVGWVRSIELLWRPRMWELLSNTLLLMVCVTTFSIILGAVCAFLLERYRFWGKPFFQVAMTLPLCIPAFVSCFTWISLTFSVEGFWGTIGIMTLSYFPLAYLPICLFACCRHVKTAGSVIGGSQSFSRQKPSRYLLVCHIPPVKTGYRQQYFTHRVTYIGGIRCRVNFELSNLYHCHFPRI